MKSAFRFVILAVTAGLLLATASAAMAQSPPAEAAPQTLVLTAQAPTLNEPPPASTNGQSFALAPGAHAYGFRCPTDLLRIIFDGDHHRVTIYRFGQPSISLSEQASSSDRFHFSNANYDLQGTYSEVMFRAGQGQAERCPHSAVSG